MQELRQQLLNFYSDEGPERVGFIMKNSGAIVEVENKSPEPYNSFDVDPSFLVEHEDEIEATFHTHPGASGNLSGDDYIAFTNWPRWKHFIVGKDGLFCYEVRNGSVIHADQAGSSRAIEGAVS